MKKILRLTAAVIFCIIILALAALGIMSIQEKEKRSEELANSLANMQNTLTLEKIHSDSLSRAVNRLSEYEALTHSLVLRDESRVYLKQVGDPVFSKIDSSRAIVTDIVIGGSSYDYYVKYEITMHDGTTIQIDPSLVF
jgi:hypothetical protein